MKMTDWPFVMIPWIVIAFLVTLSFASDGQTSSASVGGIGNQQHRLIREGLSGGKKRLAQSFLSTDLRNREAISVKHELSQKLEKLEGSTASSFHSFNQNFILDGRKLYRLEGSLNPKLNYRLEYVTEFKSFLGEVLFVKNVEWGGLLYLLAVYKQGLLQLFTVALDNRVTLHQTIKCHGIPSDVEFFIQDQALFLVVTAQNGHSKVPVSIYRWRGTQLDEEENSHFEIGATAVSTFSFRESVIIVVAVQGTDSRKAGLVILQHSGSKLQMVQFLSMPDPIDLQHFTFRKENYLLVTSTAGKSVICWWAGTELIEWHSLENGLSARSVGVGYIRGETIIVLAEKAKLKLYRPTESALQFIDDLDFGSEVQSASLFIREESLSVLAITASAGILVPIIIELQFVFQPVSVTHRYLTRDPLLQCISEVDSSVRSRGTLLKKIISERAQLALKTSSGRFKGKIIVSKLALNDAHVRSAKLSLNSSSETLTMAAPKLQDAIKSSQESVKLLSANLKDVVFKSSPSKLSKKLIAHKLDASKVRTESVFISNLNRRKFDPQNILMNSKNQKLSGTVNLGTLTTDNIRVHSVNSMQVNDLLGRGGHQVVSGLKEVGQIKANKIIFHSESVVNSIPLPHVVTFKPSGTVTVRGTKTFSGLDLQHLMVNLFNNEIFNNWIASLRPTSPLPSLPEFVGVKDNHYTVNGNLHLQNLDVTGSINDIPFNNLLVSLFLKGYNQTISGDITYTNELTVQELQASVLNNVESSVLMTRTTDQVLLGSLFSKLVQAPDLVCGSVNSLKLRDMAAYVNSPLPVLTPVTFQRLQSRELYLPPNAVIAGENIGERLMSQPKIVYKGNVIVKGTLRLTDAWLNDAKVKLGGTEVNFTNIELLYWVKNGPQVIYDTLQAPQGLRVNSLSVRTINNVLVDTYIDLARPNLLLGTWHLQQRATIVGDLVHDRFATQSPVSPKHLSSVIVKTSGDYSISGKKEFLGGVVVDHLLSEYLDTKKVADIFNGKPHPGSSIFEEIWVGGDLTIHSNLDVGSANRVNLCERLKQAIRLDGLEHIRAATFSVVTASNIALNTINGVPMDVISGANQPGVPRVHKITIKGDVNVPGFNHVLNVNSKSVTTDLLSRVVDRTKSGLIRGKKTFASVLKVEGHFDALEYDGISLKDLFSNVLSKTRPQTISSRIRMKEISTSELNVNIVNDVDMGNLLFSDFMSLQTVEGGLMFISDLNVAGYLSTSNFEDNCDLSMVNQRLQTLDGRHWSVLVVEGNLAWRKTLPLRVQGLSYYFNSSVTKDKEQIISGEISFLETVSVENFKSRMDINDIAITGILMDSLRKSAPHQVVTANIILQGGLQSSSMKVLGNVVAKNIGGVDIAQFNRSLVRVSGDQDVRGHKRFLAGFSSSILKVDGAGTVNGLSISEVAAYDLPLIAPVKFVGPLEIEDDFEFTRVNDHKFDDFMLKRVTLDGVQNVDGHISFTRDLVVEGHMVAPRINNLDISDIVLRDSLNEQVIGGRKHFKQGLRVDGPMEVDRVSSVGLRMAYAAALLKDTNATINGDMVFGSVVTLGPNLDVERTVNDIEMAQLARDLQFATQRSEAQVRSIARTISEVNSLLTARGDLSEMLYLEHVADVPLSFTNTGRAVSKSVSDSESYIDVYGWASHSLCGLPASCACPAQYTVHVDSENLKDVSWKIGLQHSTSERFFSFYLDNPSLKVVVKTNTVSSSSRCKLPEIDRLNEFTTLSWTEVDTSHNSSEVTLVLDPTRIFGYISDVQVIAHNNRVYLVLGIAYNADLDTTNVNSVIVRVDRKAQRVKVVSEFPTYGVSALDVFQTSQGYHIAVGNSYDSSTSSSQSFLDIYRFHIENEKLELKKRIPSDGVVSISSVVQGGDSLIIFAQKQLYAPVVVLKYNSEHDDYHVVQQLNANNVPTGLGAFYIGLPGRSDAFLGVSTADDQFYLYKFGHVEGFKLVLRMELQGVQGFTSFSAGHKQYLLFTSTSSPLVFEIVKQVA